MFGILYPTSDIVSSSLGVATITVFSAAVLAFLGLTWVSERWRVPLALSAVALLASAMHYLDTNNVWLHGQQLSAAHRYVGWFTVHPLQVAAVFFFARLVVPVPVGVFWRTMVAAILMVLCRYLGDAAIFNGTLGVLLSIAFWLYILGEMYFGAMGATARTGSRAIRLGYFWIRLIMTIGWAIYPILHFVDVVIGAGHAPAVIVIYTIADFINLIVVSMVVLAVAGQERY